MKKFRWILWPFGILFGFIASMRRTLYDFGVLKRREGALKTIVVGNLTVGGTGKTPMVIWLAKHLQGKKISVLSRGYGRSSKGFMAANPAISALEFGDEPLEIYESLDAKVPVFVCENRLQGLEEIVAVDAELEIALLDDGFQHLRLMPDVSLLLCNYEVPFYRNWPLPAGNLREFAYNARFADAIVVSKCPDNLDMTTAMEFYARLARYGKPVFFAAYKNAIARNKGNETLAERSPVILVSALANNRIFETWAGRHYQVQGVFAYRDHYQYTSSDAADWITAMKNTGAAAILTTRKDIHKMEGLVGTNPVFETHTEVEILFRGEEQLIPLILKKIEK